ncbi:unnamed protein product [Soboliphyme baturini]|uniref:Run domain Beclin-1-interacting and cysteine-rich domain-containing protein n=1 Tax=Soboliphyme baturini TaxID=241478 RepID=A0A183IK84_9BILA|nr:unnamed protein product [Soboliphyme baturini]
MALSTCVKGGGEFAVVCSTDDGVSVLIVERGYGARELNEVTQTAILRQQESKRTMEEMHKLTGILKATVMQNSQAITSALDQLQQVLVTMKESCEVAEKNFLNLYQRTVIVYRNASQPQLVIQETGNSAQNPSLPATVFPCIIAVNGWTSSDRPVAQAVYQTVNNDAKQECQSSPITLASVVGQAWNDHPVASNRTSVAPEPQTENSQMETIDISSSPEQAEPLSSNLPANLPPSIGKKALNAYEIAQRFISRFVSNPGFQTAVVKYVLNSDGGELLTECLYRPTQWNRLTNRKKDCYRCLYALLNDEACISILSYVATALLRKEDFVTISAPTDAQAKITPLPQALPRDPRLRAHQSVASTSYPSDFQPITDLPEVRDDPPTKQMFASDFEQTMNKFLRTISKQAKVKKTRTQKDCTLPVPKEDAVSVTKTSKNSTVGQKSGQRHDDISADRIRRIYENELTNAMKPWTRKRRSLRACTGGSVPVVSAQDSRCTRESRFPDKRTNCKRKKTVEYNLRTSAGLSMSSGTGDTDDDSNTENHTVLTAGSTGSRTSLDASCEAPSIDLQVVKQQNKHHDSAETYHAGNCHFDSLRSTEAAAEVSNVIPVTTGQVLPPLKQEQIDRYNYLNTADLVDRLKNYLCQYSISQRAFGSSVLGLTQSTTSDLLTKPKRWHSMTQKGREPYIRIKLFLDSEESARKMMLSQGDGDSILSGSDFQDGGPVVKIEDIVRRHNFVVVAALAPSQLEV